MAWAVIAGRLAENKGIHSRIACETRQLMLSDVRGSNTNLNVHEPRLQPFMLNWLGAFANSSTCFAMKPGAAAKVLRDDDLEPRELPFQGQELPGKDPDVVSNIPSWELQSESDPPRARKERLDNTPQETAKDPSPVSDPVENQDEVAWRESRQRSFPVPCKNLVAVFVGVLSVAGMAATTHSMCGSIDPTMQGAKVEIMKRLVPFGISRGCFESALDSCILQFNGTVIDSFGKQSYLETWQNQGFPPINCRDLGSEIWVRGFPQNCEGTWSDFGPCSASCGGGTRSCAFQITRPAQNGGARCREMNQLKTEKCNDQPCPVDCVLLDWQPDVSGCSKLCGNGTVKETRGVQHDASHGGDCPDPTSEQRERWATCNVDPCPVSLVEDFQGTLAATAKSVQSIGQTLAVSRTLTLELLQNHPQFNCSAGISEDMAETAAACAENNVLATKTEAMSSVFEQVQDECGMIVPIFREMVNSLLGDLPALIKYLCSGITDSAEATFSLLYEQINSLLQQIEKCRSPSKELKAKNKDLLSRRSGHSQDIERRSSKVLAELKNLELDEPSLKTEVRARAVALENAKQSVNEKQEELKKSGRQFDDLKQHQLSLLNRHKAQSANAKDNAAAARQQAQNLDSSLKLKERAENMGRLNRAFEKATGFEKKARQQEAEYMTKIDEYNRAVAHEESVRKQGEEAVRSQMQTIAENQRLSHEARVQQIQVGKVIQGKLLELQNLNRFKQLSQASDQSQLDRNVQAATETLQTLAVKFKQFSDYLKSLKVAEGRLRTGPAGCDHVRHIVANIVNSARELFKVAGWTGWTTNALLVMVRPCRAISHRPGSQGCETAESILPLFRIINLFVLVAAVGIRFGTLNGRICCGDGLCKVNILKHNSFM